MEHTIKYWLNRLEEPFRTQALENTAKHKLKDKVPSMSESLWCAFAWINTSQGFRYWSDLAHEILKKEKKQTQQ